MERENVFCKNCGKELEPDSRFCPSCGTPIVKPKIVEVIKCRNCGAKIKEDAQFCPKCGTSVIEEKKEEVKNSYNCPVCGGLIPSNAIKCQFCGYEIQGRVAVSSVKEFAKEIVLIEDESKKIETIKLFPIPNTKEDIMEFMYLATSNFDPKNQKINSQGESVAKAWHTKIEQCYSKAKTMFDYQDMASIESLYQKALDEIAKYNKIKSRMIMLGAILIAVSIGLIAICFALLSVNENAAKIPTAIAFLLTLPVGIPVFVVGVKRKRFK